MRVLAQNQKKWFGPKLTSAKPRMAADWLAQHGGQFISTYGENKHNEEMIAMNIELPDDPNIHT